MEQSVLHQQLSECVEKFGTPLYVYVEESIDAQLTRLHEAFGSLPHLLCYAVKAASNLSLLRQFHQKGCGFDIVSEGELRRVAAAGCPTQKVVFAGVGKTREEITQGLHHEILFFNVESASELKLIEEVAKTEGRKAPISFRVNPEVNVETHPYLSTGLKTSKFGVPLSDFPDLAAYALTSPHLELRAIDCHIGSGINTTAPLEEAYRCIRDLAYTLLREKNAPLKYLDLGGGFGISYSGKTAPLDMTEYQKLLSSLFSDTPLTLIVEPGKFLIAEAGILLTRVVHVKENGEYRFAVVDAGMNDLLRPSLYDGYHAVELVQNGSVEAREMFQYSVVGPVCETGCFLAKERSLPRMQSGDLLALRDAGAYGMSMASQYNSRRLPAEVFIRVSGKLELIRRRQEFGDLWVAEFLDES